MKRSSPSGNVHRADAAYYFDFACRNTRLNSNKEIADALGREMGVAVSRRAIAAWRSGELEVKASYLAAAFKLANIVVEVKLNPPPRDEGEGGPDDELRPRTSTELAPIGERPKG